MGMSGHKNAPVEKGRMRPLYLLPIAIAVLIFGIYEAYLEFGWSWSLVPDIVSIVALTCLIMEMATGEMAIVDLRQWDKIQIGLFGKLAVPLFLLGACLNLFI